jgi:hypothetical protein
MTRQAKPAPPRLPLRFEASWRAEKFDLRALDLRNLLRKETAAQGKGGRQ